MHVFVTGGSGLVGSALVAELLGNGHSVVALARSEASAHALEAAGAEPLRGDLGDLETLRSGAAYADGVIHLAFANDFSSPEGLAQAVAEESTALQALRRRARRQRPPAGDPVGNPSCAGPHVHRGRPAPDGRACRRSLPLGHGRPRPGRATGSEQRRALATHRPQRGQGRVRRPAHRAGTPERSGPLSRRRHPALAVRPRPRRCRPFRLALERAPAGTAWHAVADEGDAVRDIVEVIGRRLGLPVEELPSEFFGALGPIFATDQPSSSTYTRHTLGWEPTLPNLLEDLERIRP